MLAGSLSDLQKMMDRLTMVSAMKIVFAGEIIEPVEEFCYLGSMISDDATEKSREGSQQRRQSGLKSGGSWIRVKNVDFYRQISEKFQFFQAILQKNIKFSRQISGNFDFFRQLKKLIFQAKKCPFTATSDQSILFLFKSNHFRTYFLIRYNNISRPVHDPTRPPAQNMGVATLSPQD